MSVPIEQRPTILDVGDFYTGGFGHFLRPLTRDHPKLREEAEPERCMELQALMERLRAGDWTASNQLLACARATDDCGLHNLAASLLGFGGTVECFRDMRAELEGRRKEKQGALTEREDGVLFTHYCRAFTFWGRLDVVPVLLDCYLSLRLAGVPDVGEIILRMSDLIVRKEEEPSMIWQDPPDDMLEDYLNLVMNTYDAVVERLGSDKVHVFRGELRSVRSIAQHIRHPVQRRCFPVELKVLREIFEPATGIDCSAFFSRGNESSALSAAIIAEDFLASPASEQYEDGARYFFGHRVPD